MNEGLRLGWDRQLSHASFSANTALCPSFQWEPLECVCACLHVKASICLGGKMKRKMSVCVCVCGWVWFHCVLKPESRWIARTCERVWSLVVLRTSAWEVRNPRTHAQGCVFQDLSIDFQTVRKSTRMWGLSHTINTTRSTFFDWWSVNKQSLSLPHSLKPWLTLTLSQPCRCRLVWYLLKFLWQVPNSSCYSRLFFFVVFF